MYETNDTLLDRAISNYNAALSLREHMGDDELFLNFTGYHLQQSVDQLIRISKENGAGISLTDYIEEHSEMLSVWEAKTRYVLGYRVELTKIDRALDEVGRYLDIVLEREKERKKTKASNLDIEH